MCYLSNDISIFIHVQVPLLLTVLLVIVLFVLSIVKEVKSFDDVWLFLK